MVGQRHLRRAVGLGTIVMLISVNGVPSVVGAGSLEEPGVPLGVSAIAASPAPDGPIAASGVLADRRGRAVAGRVAVLAWPSQELQERLDTGDAFTTPTIGWVATDARGRFSVPIDPSRIPADYVGAGGRLNLQLVGWDATREANWVTSTDVPDDAVTLAAGVAADGALGPLVAHPVTLRLDTRRADAGGGTQPGSGISPAAFPNPDGPSCQWYLRSSYRVTENAALTFPYYAKAWVKLGLQRSVTQGFAMNAQAAWGGFSVAGTMTTTTGVTWEPAPTSSPRYWNIEMWYGRYEEICGIGYDPFTLRWAFAPRYPTGGTSSSSPGTRPRYPNSNCATISPAGTWSRSRSDGNATTFSAGVKSAGFIGFNMSFKANYGTTTNAERIIYYRFTRSSIRLCGNNDTPATAGIVIEQP